MYVAILIAKPLQPKEASMFGKTAVVSSYGDFWCMGDIEKVAYPAD